MPQTAMQIMYEELICYEYTIPLEIIVKCKELIEVEKEQIINGFDAGERESQSMWYENGKQYFNETYNK